ncbi:sulfatase [Joostella atrarenae]|nr:sulfatase [Joostella atrarenae]
MKIVYPTLSKMQLQSIVFSIVTSFLYSCAEKKEEVKVEKPNVVFIAVDDLRPDLGCYGNEVVKSPNIDKLASEGVVFKNHFVNVPTCGASRQCLITGIRPSSNEYLRNSITEKVISNKPEGEEPESFIHQLRRNGYHTVGIGKITHSVDGYLYGYEEEVSDKKELPYSWDELLFNSGKWGTGWNAFFGYENGENRQSLNRQVKPYEKGAVSDTGYVDGLTAQLAVSKLKDLKESSKPFFMGVGLFKPHLPFNSPEKYWNLYDRDSIPTSENPLVPENVNLASIFRSGEFNGYKLGDEKATLDHPMSPEYSRKLRHAYYACVSYIDQQIGNIVDEIKAQGLDKNTIIVIWGDHGWHLGDQQIWGKHTIFENALKSPLIIKVPGAFQNQEVTPIVETVDIYPSLLELCGVKMPHKVDGESFVEVLKGSNAQDDNVAYSYFRKGITMRTQRYRLTKYYREQQPAIELYDHKEDPLESVNVAAEHPDIVADLMPLLEKGNSGIYK